MGEVTDAIKTILDPDHGLGRLSETWASVPGKWPYWISDEGRVYSEHSGKILSLYTNESDTYLVANLRCNGDRKQRLVHQMVAESFLDEDRNGREVNHRDGDPTNNEVSNLEWVRAENHATEKQKAAGGGALSPSEEPAPF